MSNPNISPKESKGPETTALQCPWCGAFADLSQWRAIAVSPALPHDPILGEGHALRFLPSAFDPEGSPLDPAGEVAHQIACPQCRLELPWKPLSTLLVRIVASQSLTSELRHLLGAGEGKTLPIEHNSSAGQMRPEPDGLGATSILCMDDLAVAIVPESPNHIPLPEVSKSKDELFIKAVNGDTSLVSLDALRGMAQLGVGP